MHLFDQLQSDLVAPLNNDAYFSDPARKVSALAENRMDLLSELDTSLAKFGICGICAITNVADGERRTEIIVTVVLQVHEVPLINRAPSGARKSALDVGVKALSIWGNRTWTPDVGVWSPLEFKGLELTDVDEENGRIAWTLRYETRTYLEIVPTLLGDESNRIFADELGRPLVVSPVDP